MVSVPLKWLWLPSKLGEVATISCKLTIRSSLDQLIQILFYFGALEAWYITCLYAIRNVPKRNVVTYSEALMNSVLFPISKFIKHTWHVRYFIMIRDLWRHHFLCWIKLLIFSIVEVFSLLLDALLLLLDWQQLYMQLNIPGCLQCRHQHQDSYYLLLASGPLRDPRLDWGLSYDHRFPVLSTWLVFRFPFSTIFSSNIGPSEWDISFGVLALDPVFIFNFCW